MAPDPEPPVDARQGGGGLAWSRGIVLDLVLVHAVLFFTVAALTPVSELLLQHHDVLLYFQVAERVVQGEVPYRDVELAYPPLALVPFVLPYVAWPVRPPAFDTYQWLFVIQSALLSTAAAVTVGWIGRRQDSERGVVRAMALYVLLAAVMAPILAWRYDTFPMIFGVGGVALATAGMPIMAGAVLGLGFAAKVFPIVLVPIIGIYYVTAGRPGSLGKLLLGFALTASLAWLPIALLAPDQLASVAAWQQDRPIHIESVQGGLHLLGHLLFGSDVEITRDFGSVNVHTPGATHALGLQTAVILAALAGTVALFFLRLNDEARRAGAPSVTTLIEGSAAVLLALILTNKVFSPQYIVWLLPFAALLRRPQVYLVVMAAVLTTVIWPLNYERLIALEPWLIIVLNVRNALLIILLVTLLARMSTIRALVRLPSRRQSGTDASAPA